MLTLQDKMNTRVHEQWALQNFEWYRAIWIECGELIEHFGYKWWKKQDTDIEQVRLEVIDIWHFGLSALFVGDKDIVTIADEIEAELAEFTPAGLASVTLYGRYEGFERYIYNSISRYNKK